MKTIRLLSFFLCLLTGIAMPILAQEQILVKYNFNNMEGVPTTSANVVASTITTATKAANSANSTFSFAQPDGRSSFVYTNTATGLAITANYFYFTIEPKTGSGKTIMITRTEIDHRNASSVTSANNAQAMMINALNNAGANNPVIHLFGTGTGVTRTANPSFKNYTSWTTNSFVPDQWVRNATNNGNIWVKKGAYSFDIKKWVQLSMIGGTGAPCTWQIDEIRIYGYEVEQGDIVSSTGKMVLSSRVGNAVNQTLKIRLYGVSTPQNVACSLSGSGASKFSCPSTIEVGDNDVDLQIDYTPSAFALDKAVLTLTSGGKEISIDLEGKGSVVENFDKTTPMENQDRTLVENPDDFSNITGWTLPVPDVRILYPCTETECDSVFSGVLWYKTAAKGFTWMLRGQNTKLTSPVFNLSVPYKITLNCRNEIMDEIPGRMSILAGNDTIIKLNDMTSTIGTRTYDGFISGENLSLVFANGDVSRCVTMFNGLILEPTSSPSLSLAVSGKVDFGSIHLPMASQTRELIFSSANLSAIPLSLSTPNTAYFSASLSENGTDSYKITVSLLAETTGSYNDYVTVSGGGVLTDRTITLNATILDTATYVENPSYNNFRVIGHQGFMEIVTNEPTMTEIYNISGRLVMQQKITSTKSCQVQSGIYLVRMTGKNEVQTKKVFVK